MCEAGFEASLPFNNSIQQGSVMHSCDESRRGRKNLSSFGEFADWTKSAKSDSSALQTLEEPKIPGGGLTERLSQQCDTG